MLAHPMFLLQNWFDWDRSALATFLDELAERRAIIQESGDAPESEIEPLAARSTVAYWYELFKLLEMSSLSSSEADREEKIDIKNSDDFILRSSLFLIKSSLYAYEEVRVR